MAKILVNIVSDQTIPNFLFIKEFQNVADNFLFISTKEMEQQYKTLTIYETAGIDQHKVKIVRIHEDELYLALNKLEQSGWLTESHQFLVNITGGTKLMSNVVYACFKSFQSRFFYLPAGKNVIKEIFDNKPSIAQTIRYHISVKEFLTLHNILYKEKDSVLSGSQSEKIYWQYKKNRFQKFPYGTFKSDVVKGQQKPGLWFEEFLCYKIKQTLHLPDAAVKQGIKLFHKQPERNFSDNLTDNEVDLVFVVNNNIFIVEAKVSIGKVKINTSALTHYLYKLAAINKRFGLRATALFVTFANLSRLSDDAQRNLENRCKVLNLPLPIDRNDFVDPNRLKLKLTSLTH